MSMFGSARIRQAVIGVGLVAAISVVLATRDTDPGAAFARAACRDLSVLVDEDAANSRNSDEELSHAAARLDRAASIDDAFVRLGEDLEQVREAVVKRADPTEREESNAEDALDSVAAACAELGAPDGERVDLAGLSIDRLRQG